MTWELFIFMITADFKTSDIEQDLNRLLDEPQEHIAELDMTQAMAATACVIKYLEVIPPKKMNGKKKKVKIVISFCQTRTVLAHSQCINIFFRTT